MKKKKISKRNILSFLKEEITNEQDILNELKEYNENKNLQTMLSYSICQNEYLITMIEDIFI